MTWNRAAAWWSQGMTAPLFMAVDDDMGRSHFSDGDETWEIRVDTRGIAYTHREEMEPLRLVECPWRP